MKNLMNLKYFLLLSCLAMAHVAFGAASSSSAAGTRDPFAPGTYGPVDIAAQLFDNMSLDKKRDLERDPAHFETSVRVLKASQPEIDLREQNPAELLMAKVLKTGDPKFIAIHNTSSRHKARLLYRSGDLTKITDIPAEGTVRLGKSDTLHPMVYVATLSWLRKHSKTLGEIAEGTLLYNNWIPFNLNDIIRSRDNYQDRDVTLELEPTATSWQMKMVDPRALHIAPTAEKGAIDPNWAVVFYNQSHRYPLLLKYRNNRTGEEKTATVAPNERIKLEGLASEIDPQITIQKQAAVSKTIAEWFGGYPEVTLNLAETFTDMPHARSTAWKPNSLLARISFEGVVGTDWKFETIPAVFDLEDYWLR